MFRLIKRRRRGLAGGALIAGTLLATVSMAAPALADTYNYTATYDPSYGSTTEQNSLIVGSGSATTYFMMGTMDLLFNQSPGCQLFDPAGNNQPLNLACVHNNVTDVTTGTTVTNENSASELGPVAGADQFNGLNENPYNDVVYEQPQLGSSNGIGQLEDSGTNSTFKKTCKTTGDGPCPTITTSFARSSRAKSGSDSVGMNFVAYAEDGLDWVHMTSAPGGGSSPSAGVTNLTDSQIEQIWTGQISNWAQLGGADAPICVYTAQDGSGTLSTWDTYLDANGSSDSHVSEDAIGTLTPNYSAAVWAAANIPGWSGTFTNGGCQNGTTYTYNSGTNTVTEGTSQAAAYGADHQILENETKQLIQVGAQQNQGYADTLDSIFFMSYGRYNLICTHVTQLCDPSGITVPLGTIDNITISKTDVIATDAPGYTGQIWPVRRYLYNVYGNGNPSASNVPVATPASINYISEVGFICKPQTYTYQLLVRGTEHTYTGYIVDPNTGAYYKTEVAAAITKNGFFQIPIQGSINNLGVQIGGEDVDTINYSAASILSADTSGGTTGPTAYTYADPLSTTINPAATQTANLHDNNPIGYCKVFTTG
jgi:ABC-type phosphate transport system substrate-binding protein